MMVDNKNLILAIVLSVAILLVYQVFFEMPRSERERVAQQRVEQVEEGRAPAQERQADAAPQLGVDTAGILGVPTDQRRDDASAVTPRVEIDSPRVVGSIALAGARFDDLSLRDYQQTTDPHSPLVDLLLPMGTARPYYAEFGWLGDNGVALPSPGTVWTADGDRLTPERPITLTWDNGEGLIFEQEISLDWNYMFTVTQRVHNMGGTTVNLAPYGLISRTGKPDIFDFYILHEGLIGVFNDTLNEVKYDHVVRNGPKRHETTGGWLGITDKYWLAALIPDQQQPVNASFSSGRRQDMDLFQADFLAETVTVRGGTSAEISNRLFAGAKEVPLLDYYGETLHIPRFDLAVDFGWFYFLTKPIFLALLWLENHLGNFGLAILALTVAIKLLFFPLANKSYRAMSKMKALQPKMMQLKERYGEDRQRLNQELMQLYKQEQVNPAAGCLPIVIQIPVFFALYKVLFVTIEMRHAPFFGWIQDLSAADPLGILTVFGLIPWDPPGVLAFLNVGLWPIIMGLTMYAQMRLNPAPTDPIQAKIFMFMPLIFTFILAPFPAGLVIYWAWNNILSIAQQWVIMKRMGVT